MSETMNRAPTHPGALLRHEVLPSMGLTTDEFARKLGLSVEAVNDLLAARRPVRTETAFKLGDLLGNSPQFWLQLQSSYDHWKAHELTEQEERPKLKRKDRESPSG